MRKQKKVKDPDYKPGATHNAGRSTYDKRSRSIKSQLQILAAAGDGCYSQDSLEMEVQEFQESKVEVPAAGGEGAGAGEGRGPHAPARQPHGHNLLSGQAAGKSQIKTTTQNNQNLRATMSF